MNVSGDEFTCAVCGRSSDTRCSEFDRAAAGEGGERWRTYMWPYEVSDLGRVRNLTTESILKPNIKPPNGYRAHTLRIDRTTRVDRYLHRMVLETFVGPPRLDDQGRHLNGDTSDNRLVNLAWGTAKENQADSRRLGTWMHGERQHRAKLTEESARAIKASTESNEVLAKRYGVHTQTVASLRRGLSWAWVE